MVEVEVSCARMVMEVGMEVWCGGVVWRWDVRLGGGGGCEGEVCESGWWRWVEGEACEGGDGGGYGGEVCEGWFVVVPGPTLTVRS